jgi:hypothetical protein
MLSKGIKEIVSREFNISESKVEFLYKLWWKEVRHLIENTDINNIDSYTDINIPYLGKLVINQNKKKYINGTKNKKD